MLTNNVKDSLPVCKLGRNKAHQLHLPIAKVKNWWSFTSLYGVVPQHDASLILLVVM
jgi:hypothetical protein